MVRASGTGKREHWSTAVHGPDFGGIACIQDCRHPSEWGGYGFKSSNLFVKGRAVFALIVRFIVLPDHLEAFDALDYHSKEDLQRWAIDRRVDEFVNKRPEEWDKTLVERLKIRPNWTAP